MLCCDLNGKGVQKRGDKWGEGDNRRWDGWMASLIQWTGVWWGRWWGTRKPGVLQSMGFQRAGHDLAAEQQQTLLIHKCSMSKQNSIEIEKWKRVKVAQSCPALCDSVDCSLSRCCAGVGCHFLLQGIFHPQGSNPVLPHCRQILYQLNHKGNWICTNCDAG